MLHSLLIKSKIAFQALACKKVFYRFPQKVVRKQNLWFIDHLTLQCHIAIYISWKRCGGSWTRIAWRRLRAQVPHQWMWGPQSHCPDLICGSKDLYKLMQGITAWPCGPGGCCQIPLAACGILLSMSHPPPKHSKCCQRRDIFYTHQHKPWAHRCL